MSVSSPVTLVMLLSMAKLQKGKAQAETTLNKRWQTPDDVLAQTQEAMSYLRANWQRCDAVVLCYTTSLYHNVGYDPLPELPLRPLSPADIQLVNADVRAANKNFRRASALHSHVEQNSRASAHKRKLQKLLTSHGIASTAVDWGELLINQNDFEQARVKLTNRYRKDNRFRLAVQQDNPKCQGESDPVPAKLRPTDPQPLGDLPTPADQFVIEEAGVFQQLARRDIVHPAIDPNRKIVLCYPGETLASLDVLLNPDRRPETTDNRAQPFTWLDVSGLPREHHYALPALPALPKPLWQKYLSNAAALALPVMVGAGLSLEPVRAVESVTVEQNAYKVVLTYRHSGRQAETAVFNKENDGTLTGSEVGYGETEPPRPAVFQGDIGTFPHLQDDLNRITGQRIFETGCGGVEARPIASIPSGIFKRVIN